MAPQRKAATAQSSGGTGSALAPTLLVRIRGLLPNLAPAERRVATTALADPGGVASATISEVARRCSTSATTVLRFCRSVGLQGYPELRVALAIAAGQAAEGEVRQIGNVIGPRDDLAAIIDKVCFADARAIEETAEQLDPSVLGRVAGLVESARRIDLYGVGASSFVCLDLQQKLYRIGHTAFAWLDPNMAITSAALLQRNDVAIAVSHTGASVDTIAALTRARSSGAATVALTNFPRSPITAVADLVLTTAARETTFRSGAMASRVAQLSVIDCLFAAVAQHHHAATLQALERTREAVADRHL